MAGPVDRDDGKTRQGEGAPHPQVALLAGMLVATTAFTVLTAAARAAQVRTIGTVNAHFQPSYDILVRPAGARSSLEEATGTVQPGFLFGIYRGITMAQWHQIEQVSGVRVAAPIAMVGYYLVDADFHHDLGERERRHPDRAAAHVRLRHPGPGPPDSHRRRDHRDPGASPRSTDSARRTRSSHRT